MTRIGPQMQRVIEIVRSNPGCSKKFVAERISPHPVPEKNWALGYAPVNRAIAAGLVAAERKGNTYNLYEAAK
jgi:hypothetical protein